MNTYIVMFKKRDSKVSLYIAQLMKRLSLNSDGALRTDMQRRMPHNSKRSSAERQGIIHQLYVLLEPI